MFKKILLFSAIGLFGVSAQVSPPPGTISSQPRVESGQTSAGNSFTNRSGASFSTAQLGSELQELRNLVEQTLPTLSAYTETVSNTAGGNRTIGGTVTDILSGVLNRRGNQQGGTAGNNVFSGTNVVNILQGLLTTNANHTTAANPTALKDLADLQNQLQAVNSTLQRLNVTGTNSIGTLTPTGR